MRPVRLPVCAALAAALTLSPVASAGPSCPFVTDPRGDYNRGGIIPPENPSPVVDILSGDIVSNDRYLTVVVRLASLDELDPLSPLGHLYQVKFMVDGKTRALRGTYGFDGYSASVSGDDHTEPYLGPASMTVNVNRAEITMTAPTSLLAVTRGATIRRIAFSAHGNNGPNAGRNDRPHVTSGDSAHDSGRIDLATTRRTYVAGSPGCVRVGA